MSSSSKLELVQDKIGLLQKNFECPICLDLMKNPVSTKCDHKFCRHCILQAIGKKTSAPCPVCKETFTKRSLSVLEEWNRIVTQVAGLVKAFQQDTGAYLSPRRGVSIPLSQSSKSTTPNRPRDQDQSLDTIDEFMNDYEEEPDQQNIPCMSSDLSDGSSAVSFNKVVLTRRNRNCRKKLLTPKPREQTINQVEDSGSSKKGNNGSSEKNKSATRGKGKKKRSVSPTSDVDTNSGGGGDVSNLATHRKHSNHTSNLTMHSCDDVTELTMHNKNSENNFKTFESCDSDFDDISVLMADRKNLQPRKDQAGDDGKKKTVPARKPSRSNVRYATRHTSKKGGTAENINNFDNSFNDQEVDDLNGKSQEINDDRIQSIRQLSTSPSSKDVPETVSISVVLEKMKGYENPRKEGLGLLQKAEEINLVDDSEGESSVPNEFSTTVDSDSEESYKPNEFSTTAESDSEVESNKKNRLKTTAKKVECSFVSAPKEDKLIGSSSSKVNKGIASQNSDEFKKQSLNKRTTRNSKARSKSLDDSRKFENILLKSGGNKGHLNNKNSARNKRSVRDTQVSITPDIFQGNLLLKNYGIEKLSVKPNKEKTESLFSEKRLTRSSSLGRIEKAVFKNVNNSEKSAENRIKRAGDIKDIGAETVDHDQTDGKNEKSDRISLSSMHMFTQLQSDDEGSNKKIKKLRKNGGKGRKNSFDPQDDSDDNNYANAKGRSRSSGKAEGCAESRGRTRSKSNKSVEKTPKLVKLNRLRTRSHGYESDFEENNIKNGEISIKKSKASCFKEITVSRKDKRNKDLLENETTSNEENVVILVNDGKDQIKTVQKEIKLSKELSTNVVVAADNVEVNVNQGDNKSSEKSFKVQNSEDIGGHKKQTEENVSSKNISLLSTKQTTRKSQKQLRNKAADNELVKNHDNKKIIDLTKQTARKPHNHPKKEADLILIQQDLKDPGDISQTCTEEKVDHWLERLPDSVSPLLSEEALNTIALYQSEALTYWKQVGVASQQCQFGDDLSQYQNEGGENESETGDFPQNKTKAEISKNSNETFPDSRLVRQELEDQQGIKSESPITNKKSVNGKNIKENTKRGHNTKYIHQDTAEDKTMDSSYTEEDRVIGVVTVIPDSTDEENDYQNGLMTRVPDSGNVKKDDDKIHNNESNDQITRKEKSCVAILPKDQNKKNGSKIASNSKDNQYIDDILQKDKNRSVSENKANEQKKQPPSKDIDSLKSGSKTNKNIRTIPDTYDNIKDDQYIDDILQKDKNTSVSKNKANDQRKKPAFKDLDSQKSGSKTNEEVLTIPDTFDNERDQHNKVDILTDNHVVNKDPSIVSESKDMASPKCISKTDEVVITIPDTYVNECEHQSSFSNNKVDISIGNHVASKDPSNVSEAINIVGQGNNSKMVRFSTDPAHVSIYTQETFDQSGVAEMIKPKRQRKTSTGYNKPSSRGKRKGFDIAKLYSVSRKSITRGSSSKVQEIAQKPGDENKNITGKLLRGKFFKSKEFDRDSSQDSEGSQAPVAFVHSSPGADDPYAFKMSQRTPKGKKVRVQIKGVNKIRLQVRKKALEMTIVENTRQNKGENDPGKNEGTTGESDSTGENVNKHRQESDKNDTKGKRKVNSHNKIRTGVDSKCGKDHQTKNHNDVITIEANENSAKLNENQKPSTEESDEMFTDIESIVAPSLDDKASKTTTNKTKKSYKNSKAKRKTKFDDVNKVKSAESSLSTEEIQELENRFKEAEEFDLILSQNYREMEQDWKKGEEQRNIQRAIDQVIAENQEKLQDKSILQNSQGHRDGQIDCVKIYSPGGAMSVQVVTVNGHIAVIGDRVNLQEVNGGVENTGTVTVVAETQSQVQPVPESAQSQTKENGSNQVITESATVSSKQKGEHERKLSRKKGSKEKLTGQIPARNGYQDSNEDQTVSTAAPIDSTCIPATSDDVTSIPATSDDVTSIPATSDDVTSIPETIDDFTSIPATVDDVTCIPATTDDVPATDEDNVNLPERSHMTKKPGCIPDSLDQLVTKSNNRTTRNSKLKCRKRNTGNMPDSNSNKGKNPDIDTNETKVDLDTPNVELVNNHLKQENVDKSPLLSTQSTDLKSSSNRKTFSLGSSKNSPISKQPIPCESLEFNELIAEAAQLIHGNDEDELKIVDDVNENSSELGKNKSKNNARARENSAKSRENSANSTPVSKEANVGNSLSADATSQLSRGSKTYSRRSSRGLVNSSKRTTQEDIFDTLETASCIDDDEDTGQGGSNKNNISSNKESVKNIRKGLSYADKKKSQESECMFSTLDNVSHSCNLESASQQSVSILQTNLPLTSQENQKSYKITQNSSNREIKPPSVNDAEINENVTDIELENNCISIDRNSFQEGKKGKENVYDISVENSDSEADDEVVLLHRGDTSDEINEGEFHETSEINVNIDECDKVESDQGQNESDQELNENSKAQNEINLEGNESDQGQNESDQEQNESFDEPYNESDQELNENTNKLNDSTNKEQIKSFQKQNESDQDQNESDQEQNESGQEQNESEVESDNDYQLSGVEPLFDSQLCNKSGLVFRKSSIDSRKPLVKNDSKVKKTVKSSISPQNENNLIKDDQSDEVTVTSMRNEKINKNGKRKSDVSVEELEKDQIIDITKESNNFSIVNQSNSTGSNVCFDEGLQLSDHNKTYKRRSKERKLSKSPVSMEIFSASDNDCEELDPVRAWKKEESSDHSKTYLRKSPGNPLPVLYNLRGESFQEIVASRNRNKVSGEEISVDANEDASSNEEMLPENDDSVKKKNINDKKSSGNRNVGEKSQANKQVNTSFFRSVEIRRALLQENEKNSPLQSSFPGAKKMKLRMKASPLVQSNPAQGNALSQNSNHHNTKQDNKGKNSQIKGKESSKTGKNSQDWIAHSHETAMDSSLVAVDSSNHGDDIDLDQQNESGSSDDELPELDIGNSVVELVESDENVPGAVDGQLNTEFPLLSPLPKSQPKSADKEAGTSDVEGVGDELTEIQDEDPLEASEDEEGPQTSRLHKKRSRPVILDSEDDSGTETDLTASSATSRELNTSSSALSTQSELNNTEVKDVLVADVQNIEDQIQKLEAQLRGQNGQNEVPTKAQRLESMDTYDPNLVETIPDSNHSKSSTHPDISQSSSRLRSERTQSGSKSMKTPNFSQPTTSQSKVPLFKGTSQSNLDLDVENNQSKLAIQNSKEGCTEFDDIPFDSDEELFGPSQPSGKNDFEKVLSTETKMDSRSSNMVTETIMDSGSNNIVIPDSLSNDVTTIQETESVSEIKRSNRNSNKTNLKVGRRRSNDSNLGHYISLGSPRSPTPPPRGVYVDVRSPSPPPTPGHLSPLGSPHSPTPPHLVARSPTPPSSMESEMILQVKDNKEERNTIKENKNKTENGFNLSIGNSKSKKRSIDFSPVKTNQKKSKRPKDFDEVKVEDSNDVVIPDSCESGKNIFEIIGTETENKTDSVVVTSILNSQHVVEPQSEKLSSRSEDTDKVQGKVIKKKPSAKTRTISPIKKVSPVSKLSDISNNIESLTTNDTIKKTQSPRVKTLTNNETSDKINSYSIEKQLPTSSTNCESGSEIKVKSARTEESVLKSQSSTSSSYSVKRTPVNGSGGLKAVVKQERPSTQRGKPSMWSPTLSQGDFPTKPRWIFVASGISKSTEKPCITKLAELLRCHFLPRYQAGVTHVLVKTDSENPSLCPRTLKYFQGIAGKAWILDVKWAIDCVRQKKLLPEEDYEIQGDTVDRANIHQAPTRARRSTVKLLKNYEICCKGEFDMLSIQDLFTLAENMGASTLKDPKFSSFSPNKQLVVVVERKHADKILAELKNMTKTYQAPIVCKEWLLDTIGEYKIKPTDNYLVP